MENRFRLNMHIEDRIQINGVWYIREDAINDSLDHLEDEEMDLAFSEECHLETEKYCFTASRLRKGNSDEFYPDIDIEFTDKRSGDSDTWKKEYWDNNNWFKGILEGNPESVESLNKETDLCSQGKRQFKAFLNRLIEEGWLII
jgi:hypothetical protein